MSRFSGESAPTCENCGCEMSFGQSGKCDSCQYEETGDDPWVINYYHCECGHEFQDQNDGPCAVCCPVCDSLTEPYSSVQFL